MRRLYENIMRRIALMVTKTLLEALDDSGQIQKLTLVGYKNDRRSGVDRYQEFGFSSNPPEGAEVIMLSLGGDRSHNIAIASEDRRYRVKNLASGETVLYNQFGDLVKLKSDGTIEVIASSQVDITAPLVHMSGNLEVDGNVQVGGNATVVGAVTAASVTAAGAVAGASVADAAGSISAMRSTYNSHTHDENGTGGGTTDAPNEAM